MQEFIWRPSDFNLLSARRLIKRNYLGTQMLRNCGQVLCRLCAPHIIRQKCQKVTRCLDVLIDQMPVGTSNHQLVGGLARYIAFSALSSAVSRLSFDQRTASLLRSPEYHATQFGEAGPCPVFARPPEDDVPGSILGLLFEIKLTLPNDSIISAKQPEREVFIMMPASSEQPVTRVGDAFAKFIVLFQPLAQHDHRLRYFTCVISFMRVLEDA